MTLALLFHLPNRDGLSIVILIGFLSKKYFYNILCWFFMILIARFREHAHFALHNNSEELT